VPHLWAAAFAAAGDVKPAIESNRLFTANVELVPMLWAGRPEDDSSRKAERRRLSLCGGMCQLKPGEEMEFWQARAAPRRRIDCEPAISPSGAVTGSKSRKRTRRAVSVLPRSRVTPGSGAYLAGRIRL
jgi:hypothetical protein